MAIKPIIYGAYLESVYDEAPKAGLNFVRTYEKASPETLIREHV